MRVLIAGANGQLGHELERVFTEADDTLALSSRQLDITRRDLSLEAVRAFRPDVIVNAAAYTKVDDCETQFEFAYAVNGAGARNLAFAAESIGAKCVYVSTDYVFNGQANKPYNEFDLTDPINAYGRSKLAGEALTRAMTHRHFIVRTSWLCGFYGGNFVKTMLKLAAEKPFLEVVNDQRGCPTIASDLAAAIKQLVQTDAYGTYHVTNDGGCTWFDFATEIMHQNGITTPIRPTTSDHFVRPARRPTYSVLDNTAWRSEGFGLLRPWQEALGELLLQLRRAQG